MENNLQNISFAFENKDISIEYSKENKGKEGPAWNEKNNPYLKKDDIPELEVLGKNNMICDKKEYQIKEYIEKINSDSNDFLDENIYNICGNCKKNENKFFCFACNKNICEKCFKECEFNEHNIKNLEEINDKNDTNKIKTTGRY